MELKQATSAGGLYEYIVIKDDGLSLSYVSNPANDHDAANRYYVDLGDDALREKIKALEENSGGSEIDLDELNTLYAPKNHTHNYAPNQDSSISIKGQNYLGMIAKGSTVNPPELKVGQVYFCTTTLKLMIGY